MRPRTVLLIQENGRTWAHGPGLQLLLATSARSQHSMPWPDALKLAGQAAETELDSGDAGNATLALFYDELGALPSSEQQFRASRAAKAAR